MDKDEAVNWVGEALGRVRDELDCCLRHYERQEFPNIVTHMQNLHEGVRSIGGVLFEYVLDLRDQAEVIKTRTETMTGQPMKVEEIGGGWVVAPEEVVVPEPEDFLW